MDFHKIKVETDLITSTDNMPSTGQQASSSTASSSQALQMVSTSQQPTASTSRTQPAPRRKVTKPTYEKLLAQDRKMSRLKLAAVKHEQKLTDAEAKKTKLRRIIDGLKKIVPVRELNYFKYEQSEYDSELSDIVDVPDSPN